jgi:ubiquinol-cytochrome c reductase iron-sulfur subunit
MVETYPSKQRVMRPLVSVALAGLRSFGKGANRTLLGSCRFASFPSRVGSGRFARRRRGAPRYQRRRREPGGPPRGWTEGLRKDASVTTSSAAEPTRRDFLYIATATAGAVGAAATLIPLISQMNPDASTIAAGAPIEVDLAPIAEGQIIKVFWRSKPIFISHRSKKEIDEARNVNVASLPDPQPDQDRVKAGHDQWLVVIGICTHLGCIPLAHQGNYDGWFCPCHGSQYDTSGRIRQGPAPLNLALPP